VEEEKKVYIGNLEYSVAEGDLAKVLEEKGITAKEIVVIMDKYSGRSKGFGFAEFETPEEAQKAIEALDGHEINGRALKVNKAQKRKPRRDGFGGGGSGGGGGGSSKFGRDRRY
jgi:cold-inducible RNA-binding protein